MVEGERLILSATVVRAIQSIKEVAKNHSDADIYVALKENNMDPNETAQKLLNQDPFHEVRRKKDKKKDVRLPQKSGYRAPIEVREPIERVEKIMKSNPTDQSVPRGSYSRNPVPANPRANQEFRVVRDNRINKNVSKEGKPPSPQNSTSTSEQRSSQISEKSSTAVNQKSSGGNSSPRKASAVKTISHTVIPKPNDSKRPSSNHSVVGVSSSSDPVHVPSLDSRSAANIGAIKRELGAVGARRQTSSDKNNLISNSHLVEDGPPVSESLKSLTLVSKTDQPSKTAEPSKTAQPDTTAQPSKIAEPSKTSQPETVLPSRLGSRSSSNHQYNSRSHQQVAGHQKASQPAKEWKRKASPKSNTNNSHGVIGSLAKSVSHPTDNSQGLDIDTNGVQNKLPGVDINENKNVFIAEHIRVSDSDRSRLTFGSFGIEVDSSKITALESLTASRTEENPSTVVSKSLTTSIPESPIVQTSSSKHVDLLDDKVQNPSLYISPESREFSENLLPDNSSPQNFDSYADIELVHNNNPSTPAESQQLQDPTELSSCSGYNPQTGYNIHYPYFRPSMDEPVRGQGLQSPQEALGSHMSNNNIPVSSISMVQQQQQPMPQMYQQVHVSPFPNVMPYRQYISPLYVPPIQMSGYSGNPTYPHISNGNNFVLMPGGSSHLGANNLKYGVQQFKSIPAGNATGFGNFATPTGYTINAPGGVGGATGIEESSRLKYKDGNLYAPNPQVETSEMWIQNPREVPNMQSASYYNMQSASYMPPHMGHTSFSAPAQSSHMQFPGLYHPSPPQVAAMAGGVNIGMAAAAAAPGAQVGAYQQQPQMSHLNWNTNF